MGLFSAIIKTVVNLVAEKKQRLDESLSPTEFKKSFFGDLDFEINYDHLKITPSGNVSFEQQQIQQSPNHTL